MKNTVLPSSLSWDWSRIIFNDTLTSKNMVKSLFSHEEYIALLLVHFYRREREKRERVFFFNLRLIDKQLVNNLCKGKEEPTLSLCMNTQNDTELDYPILFHIDRRRVIMFWSVLTAKSIHVSVLCLQYVGVKRLMHVYTCAKVLIAYILFHHIPLKYSLGNFNPIGGNVSIHSRGHSTYALEVTIVFVS